MKWQELDQKSRPNSATSNKVFWREFLLFVLLGFSAFLEILSLFPLSCSLFNDCKWRKWCSPNATHVPYSILCAWTLKNWMEKRTLKDYGRKSTHQSPFHQTKYPMSSKNSPPCNVCCEKNALSYQLILSALSPSKLQIRRSHNHIEVFWRYFDFSPNKTEFVRSTSHLLSLKLC